MGPAQTLEAAGGTSLSHTVSEHWRRSGVENTFEGTVLITIILSSRVHCRWRKENEPGEGGCVCWAALFAPEMSL